MRLPDPAVASRLVPHPDPADHHIRIVIASPLAVSLSETWADPLSAAFSGVSEGSVK